MASLAEMFISDIQQQNREPLSKSDVGWQVGADLAKLQQAKIAQKAALQKQQQELEQAKLEKLGGFIDTLAKMPEGAGKKVFGEKFLPAAIESLGMQDKVHPLVLEGMIKDQKLLVGVKAWIANGGDPSVVSDPAKFMEAVGQMGQLGSAEQIKSVFEGNPEAISKEREQYLQRKNARDTAHITGSYQQQRQATEIATTGQVSADREFGKDVAGFAVEGSAKAQKNIDRLRSALTKLQDTDIDTKSYRSKIPVIGNFLLEMSQPELAEIRDDIRNAIQGGLKEVLGGQYTQKEGEDMFNRAFNTSYKSDQNARNVMRELSALENMKANKDAAVAYFKQHGTIQGFGGQNPAQDRQAPPPSDAASVMANKSTEYLEQFLLNPANKENRYLPEVRRELGRRKKKK